MANTTITILTDTNGKWEVTGEKFRADGWFGSTDGLHTVSIHVRNLRGRVFVEASLANEPTEDDWFPIWLSQLEPYIEYPKNAAKPTGSITSDYGDAGDTTVSAFAFQANIAWIRTRLSRDYLGHPPSNEEDIARYGVIEKVLLSH